MVRILVILDGASEPPRAGAPTSLERAATPALDALCANGILTRLRTVAPGLAPGSESAIPALLGWTPPTAVDRGAVEAAAWEIPVAFEDGERAWRVDVRAGDGSRADAGAARAAAAALAAALPDHRVAALAGHRLLVVGSGALRWTDDAVAGLPGGPTLESLVPPRLLDGLAPHPWREGVVSPRLLDGHTLHLWPHGVVPPRLLGERTVVVAARGAAAGIGRLMGASVVVPEGATGRPGSDLAAKTRAACAALEAGAELVVVHVGAPDEAAHEGDSAAKTAAIEAADRDVIATLAEAAHAHGATLTVCPDHGCDPADGRHGAEPVPCVAWTAGAAPGGPEAGRLGAAARADAAYRLTERAVARLPVRELPRLEVAIGAPA
jgi:2,3-bisphosphoglycerate-independent phosphoglycerate mutase